MRKKDFVKILQEDYGLTPTMAKGIYHSFIDAMTTALAEGGFVDLQEFGRFTVRKSKPRMGRNPWTGDRIEIPAKLRVHFKAKKPLMEVVNGMEEIEDGKRIIRHSKRRVAGRNTEG